MKEFLSSHGIAFAAKNIAEDPGAREELVARTGRMAVPEGPGLGVNVDEQKLAKYRVA